MPRMTLTDTYQLLGTGLTAITVQASNAAEVFIGAGAPAATDPGFTAKWNLPIDLNVQKFGGVAYARGNGTLTYATSTS